MGTRINVRNAKYCPISANTTSSYTLGTAVQLPELRSIELSASLATGSLYGDGRKVEDTAKLTGVTCNIALNKIPVEARAYLQGATLGADGILTVKDTDVAPEVALYFETDATDGSKEEIWLLVGKAQPISLSAVQKEDQVTYSTDNLTIGCVARKKDGAFYKIADTDNNSALTTANATAFASNPDLT